MSKALRGRSYCRNGVWYADFYAAGKRIRRACPNKTEADKLVTKARVEEFEGRHFEAATFQPVGFAEFTQEFFEWAKSPNGKKTWKNDHYAFQRFLKLWGARKLHEVSKADVEAYMASRSQAESTHGGRKVKGSAINREVTILRAFYYKAEERKKLPGTFENPCASIKLFKEDALERQRYLSEDEIVRLEAELRGPERAHLYGIVAVALNTGMRRGEILGLRWSDVDAKGGVVRVRSSHAKTGRSRAIPINGAVREVLGKWMGLDRTPAPGADPYLFARPDGGRYVELKTAFTKALRRAKITGFRFHDLRHTFATYALRRGVTMREVADLLGHSTMNMTMRYANVMPERLAAGLTGLYGPGTPPAQITSETPKIQ
jgi:integrase